MVTETGGDELNRFGGREGAPHDAVGAYVLDALPEQERAAFEEHLATCEACRREVGQLAPVVALLPRLLELDLAVTEAGDREAPAPTPELRSRILDAVRGGGQGADSDERAAEEPTPFEEPPAVVEPAIAAEEPIPFPARRARGRIRTGVTSGPRSAPASPWETMGRVNRGWLAAAVLALVAVAAIVWALALQGNIDDKEREIAALQRENSTIQQELANIRRQANASAWHLEDPNSPNQANADGTLLYSLQDQTGALIVRNLPELPSDEVYQSWLIKGTNTPPEPGPTFSVDEQGTGVAVIEADASTYAVVAVTREAAGGSDEPTLPILLQGPLSGAAGAIPGVEIAAVHLTPPDDGQIP